MAFRHIISQHEFQSPNRIKPNTPQKKEKTLCIREEKKEQRSFLPLLLLHPRKMLPSLNLHANYGLPLCVSGITHRHTISDEMADHDRRRDAVKNKISKARERVHGNRVVGFGDNHGRVAEQAKEGEAEGDHIHYDPCLAYVAKAA